MTLTEFISTLQPLVDTIVSTFNTFIAYCLAPNSPFKIFNIPIFYFVIASTIFTLILSNLIGPQ